MQHKCLLLLLLLLSNALWAQYTVETVPNPKSRGDYWVSNPDNILSAATEAALEEKLDKIERLTSTEAAVVMLNSIGSVSPADFATELFNRWGVGKKEQNNGLLILMIKDQRRIEFRTGYGLEATLPDALCVQLQQQYIVPKFKQGDFDGGMIAGLDAVGRLLVGDNKWENTPSTDELPTLEALFAKKGRSYHATRYVVDVDSILRDSTLVLANISAAGFADSMGLPVYVYIYRTLQGIAPAKMATFLMEKGVLPDSLNNFILMVFDAQAQDNYLAYQFSKADLVINDPLLMLYLSDVTKSNAGQGVDMAVMMAFLELAKLSGDEVYRNEAHRIQAAKVTPAPTAPSNYEEPAGSGNGFWWWLFVRYLWALGGLLVLTAIFIGIVQTIADPYKKYHTLTFFALDIWMYIFPLPYFFVGKLVDKLRQQYRDAPRNSPKTGQPMTKMAEGEEDKYLKSGQITEERINSIHYDVWATEDKQDLLILPYKTIFSKYSRCPKCSFRTYFLVYNRTIRSATTSSSGLGEKKYSCENCGHVHQYTYVIPRIQQSSSSGGSSGGGSSSSFGGGSSGGGGGGSSW